MMLSEGKGFMDGLPDPMKVDPATLIFVLVLVTGLFVFLKYVFFKPIIQLMDDREAAIQSGTVRRAEAAALVEGRQADYAVRLKDLRAQAFEHRKALSAVALKEKEALLERARREAGDHRKAALTELNANRERAKVDLMTQVDALSETMVSHLLHQA